MKQSKLLIMAAFGIVALSACGQTTPAKNTPGAQAVGTGNGTENNGGGTENNGGGSTETTPVVVVPDSKIPAGPTGALSGNVDFSPNGENGEILRGLIGGISSGAVSPEAILGGLSAVSKAFSQELNVGKQGCDAGGTFTSNSTGGDADKDGIPTTAMVSFNNCTYKFVTNKKAGSVVLNGTLELADHNPSDDDGSFMFVTSLNVSGSGAVDLGGTVIDLNGSAKLNLGLDIMKKSSSYDIAFGADLTIDGKTVAARLDINIAPTNMDDFTAGGALRVNGKLGLSEPGSDTVIGLSSNGITYDRNCSSIINKGSFKISDGKNNLEITQKSCNVTDAKLNGNFISL
jgi:hypothetical protein